MSSIDSFDDMFELSDEELPISKLKSNPMEEHLMKQLTDIQARIESTTDNITELRGTTNRILKSLQCQAQYGENITSDSDGELYTLEGQPVTKRKKGKTHKRNQILVVHNTWKRIIQNKWIIGINLQNTSTETLLNLRVYACVKGLDETRGSSAFWCSDGTLWHRVDVIRSQDSAVAIVVLDLPTFDEHSFCDTYGTISYQMDETLYQTPLPTVRLLVKDVIDDSYQLNFSQNVEQSVLTLKSTSIEKIVVIQIGEHSERGESLLNFLEKNNFEEVCSDVYIVCKPGCLMHNLIEILPIQKGEVSLRVCSRSNSQISVLVRLLQDQFSDAIVKQDNHCEMAVNALLEEMKMYLEDASSVEIEIARLNTDLLIL